MNKYKIRFNQTRGTPGRGSVDHVWRVFDGDQEYIVKNFRINVPCFGEQDEQGDKWNVSCHGYLSIDRATSTATITAEPDPDL